MTLLLKTHRNDITCHLLDATFRERELRLRQEEHALGLRLLREMYGEADLRRMAELPDGWLPLTRGLQFFLSSAHHLDRVELIDPVRVTANHSYRYQPSDGWIEQWEAHKARRVSLRTERRALEMEVRGTLAAFRTIEKLAAEWPEGYAHFPQPALAPANLPALRIEDINARIAAAREVA